jgi:hypothetical protein
VRFVPRLHLNATAFIAHADAKPNENDDATKHAILKTLFSFQLAKQPACCVRVVAKRASRAAQKQRKLNLFDANTSRTALIISSWPL